LQVEYGPASINIAFIYYKNPISFKRIIRDIVMLFEREQIDQGQE
jgi:hypothetical protein